MRVYWLALLACLGLVSLSSPVRADDDLVDNPSYLVWAKFPVKSFEVLTGTMQAGQMKIDMTLTRKLIDKNDDHVTVESTSVVNIMGQDHPSPPTQQEVKAKSPKKDIQDLGTEKIDANGKTYECHVYTSKGVTAKTPNASAKIWMSDEVPGGLVKMEVKTDRGDVVYLLKSTGEDK